MTINFRLFLGALLLLCVIGLANRADAADATSTWTAPTANTDGTVIPATGAGSIVSHRLEWGTCSGTAFGTKIAEAVVLAPALTYTVTNLAPGTYCFRVYAKNTYGIESAPSGVVSKVVPAPVPNPPTLVTVSVVAYELKPNGLRMVGTLPLGTPCAGDVLFQTLGQDFYAVPRGAVAPAPGNGVKTIVAACAPSA